MRTILSIINLLGIMTLLAQENFQQYLLSHPNQNYYVTKTALDEYYTTHPKGRGSGYKQYMRWAIETEKYVYPSGEMYNVSARRLAEYSRFQRTLSRNQMRATHGEWLFEGPNEYILGSGWAGGIGRINCITIHPTNPSIIYAGTPAGGLWVSYDSGNSWIAVTDGLASAGVSGIVLDYNNPFTMYLLTGDGDGNYTASIGVMKSVDGGITWLPTDLSFTIDGIVVSAYKLVMHPTNPQILFVAASNGIWRTLNGGEDWTLELSRPCTDIEFKPGTPSTMYAAVDTGFYRSSTTGDTWILDNDPEFPSSWSRIAIAVASTEPEYVYLLFGGHIAGTGNGQFSGLCRSTDSGGDFVLQSNTPNILGYSETGQDSAHLNAWAVSIAVDPLNADNVYTGGVNVWKSIDAGVNWNILSHWEENGNTIGYTHADIHALEFNGTTLYCGSDGGFYSTYDAGDTWIELSSGLANMQFYAIDIQDDILCGGAQDNGTNQWLTSTLTATQSRGADGFACLINYNDTDIRYQSDQDFKYQSTDGGNNFINISPDTLKDYWESDWIMDSVDPDILFVAKREIWRTTTGGVGMSAWTDLNAGFTGDPKIRAMSQGVSNRNVLYATNYASLRKSTNVLDATPTWSDKTNGLPGTVLISDIAIDPTNASRVWVTFFGFSSGNKVYFSPDGGDTWFNESGSLPNIPVNCIIHEPGSDDGLYIGTDFGIFYTNDNIGDWIFYANGLPNTIIKDLDVEGGRIYAGTFGRGMWSSELYSSCLTDLTLTPANDPGSPYFTGVQVYHASNSLTSTRIIQGGFGTDVHYFSNGSLTLLEGFEVRADNLFEAKLDGCPD
ncbi:MAG TPA: hypothetical protein VI603_03405 [Saprospiraceae bacterium]|nr:hypothetical protein [Saprospiraceae bacterium]